RTSPESWTPYRPPSPANDLTDMKAAPSGARRTGQPRHERAPYMDTLTLVAPTPPSSRWYRRAQAKKRGFGTPSWFAIPLLAFFGGIVAVPTLLGVYYAFTDWDGLSAVPQFIGFGNFIELFQQPKTMTALGNTVLIAVCVTVV